MKKLFSTLMLVLVALTVQAQILQPVKWKIQLNDSGSAEKEIVFTATADKAGICMTRICRKEALSPLRSHSRH